MPNLDLFVVSYCRKKAVLSSQIQDTQSALRDVLTAEARVLFADTPDDVDEVRDDIGAMNHGLERILLAESAILLFVDESMRAIEKHANQLNLNHPAYFQSRGQHQCVQGIHQQRAEVFLAIIQFKAAPTPKEGSEML